MGGSGCLRRLKINLSLFSASVFVVWFLWNNLIKVAGWLNSERKLGYICLSSPLKSISHPATLLPGVIFIIFSFFERREKVGKKLPLSHYFCNYFSGCQKIRPNHNQKKGKNVIVWSDFDLAAPRRRSNASWKAWFLLPPLSKASFIYGIFDIIHKSIWLVARCNVKEGNAY